ncbi:unnamed protein product [Urochloa humidicola]
MLSPKQFPLLIHGCIQVFFTTVDVQAALRAGASACVAFSDALSSGMWAISRVNVSCMFESMYLNLHLMEKQQRKRITNSEKEKEESEGLLLLPTQLELSTQQRSWSAFIGMVFALFVFSTSVT